MMLLGASPTPTRMRCCRSAIGNPLPRTSPARSQVPTKTSGSVFIMNPARDELKILLLDCVQARRYEIVDRDALKPHPRRRAILARRVFLDRPPIPVFCGVQVPEALI